MVDRHNIHCESLLLASYSHLEMLTDVIHDNYMCTQHRLDLSHITNCMHAGA